MINKSPYILKRYIHSGRNTYSFINCGIYCNSLCKASHALLIAARSEFLLSQTCFHHRPLILHGTPLQKEKKKLQDRKQQIATDEIDTQLSESEAKPVLTETASSEQQKLYNQQEPA